MLKVFSFILPSFFISLSISAQTKIPVEEASKHIGETVTVCDKVYETDFMEKSRQKATFLKMGGVYPMHKIDIVIHFRDRKNFGDKPEAYYLDKDVCITGKVVEFKGKPQIIISKPAEIQLGAE